jgi:Family of unknown function (DUF6527)
MKPEIVLKHEFVDFIPDELEQGTIYVSIRFATASHLCCCGCGNKVVTPIRPTDWKLIFDGKTISLDPSIGNWSLACQSHYWIRNNRVKWARRWSQKEIETERAHDRLAKQRYFDTSRAPTGSEAAAEAEDGRPEQDKSDRRLWRKLK